MVGRAWSKLMLRRPLSIRELGVFVATIANAMILGFLEPVPELQASRICRLRCF